MGTRQKHRNGSHPHQLLLEVRVFLPIRPLLMQADCLVNLQPGSFEQSNQTTHGISCLSSVLHLHTKRPSQLEHTPCHASRSRLEPRRPCFPSSGRRDGLIAPRPASSSRRSRDMHATTSSRVVGVMCATRSHLSLRRTARSRSVGDPPARTSESSLPVPSFQATDH